MINLYLLYFVGLLIATDLLLAWFGTDFPAHLAFKDTWDDFRAWCNLGLGNRGFFLALFGRLLVCPVCLAHWFSAVVALVLCHICGLRWECALVGIFTWPLLSFAILKKLGIV